MPYAIFEIDELRDTQVSRPWIYLPKKNHCFTDEEKIRDMQHVGYV